MSELKLSILICSIEERKKDLVYLLQVLTDQIGPYRNTTELREGYTLEKYIGAEAEIIICTDNRILKVGTKRNILGDESRGLYRVYIDDDDLASAEYVKLIIEKTKTNPDVIVFDAYRYQNDQPDRIVKYGTEFKTNRNTEKFYYRIPNHLMAVRNDIAKLARFKDINFGEDTDYAQRILPMLKKQERIERFLYIYNYSDRTSRAKR